MAQPSPLHLLTSVERESSGLSHDQGDPMLGHLSCIGSTHVGDLHRMSDEFVEVETDRRAGERSLQPSEAFGRAQQIRCQRSIGAVRVSDQARGFGVCPSDPHRQSTHR